MENLLHNFLTRMGRERTPEEIEWQIASVCDASERWLLDTANPLPRS